MDLNPSYFRMFLLVVLFGFSIHVVGCFYWMVALATDDDWGEDASGRRNSWLPEKRFRAMRTGHLRERYSIALYWAVTCMLSLSSLVQAGDTLKPPQYWFSYICAFAGLVLQAAIIGGVTNLFDNLDERANEKRKQLEELERWMMYERVPQRLQSRVREFHEYLLECGHTRNTERHLEALPVSLRLNIDLCLKRHLVDALPLLRACTSVEIIMILRLLVSRITMPAEIITRHSQPAAEMYFVSRGQVAILAKPLEGAFDAAPKVVTTLNVGAFFGELPLLHAALASRTETSQSLGYGECMVLTKEKFDSLMRKSTGFAYVVRTVARERLEKAMFLDASRRKAAQSASKRRSGDRDRHARPSTPNTSASRRTSGDASPQTPTGARASRRSGDEHVLAAGAPHNKAGGRRVSVAPAVLVRDSLRKAAATVRRRLSIDDRSPAAAAVADAPKFSVYDIVEGDLVAVESSVDRRTEDLTGEKDDKPAPRDRSASRTGSSRGRRSSGRGGRGGGGHGSLVREASRRFAGAQKALGPGGRNTRFSHVGLPKKASS